MLATSTPTAVAKASADAPRCDPKPLLEQLDAARRALGMSASTFGFVFFGYPTFLWTARKRTTLNPATVAKIDELLARFARGEVVVQDKDIRPVGTAAPLLDRTEAARTDLGLSMRAFSQLVLGRGGYRSLLQWGTTMKPETAARLNSFLEKYDRGGFVWLKERDEPLRGRLEAARAELGLSQQQFGRLVFGGGGGHYRFVRTQPQMRLQAATAERIYDFLACFERGEFDHLRREAKQ